LNVWLECCRAAVGAIAEFEEKGDTFEVRISEGDRRACARWRHRGRHVRHGRAFFGGTVKRTNDPSLVDAVFFSVQDNGEPGKTDQISRVFFWDDDPNTTGDPQACMLNQLGDFPMETIEKGNIQVRPTTP
jgi:hypothetical protein